jgi:hypothetical protein
MEKNSVVDKYVIERMGQGEALGCSILDEENLLIFIPENEPNSGWPSKIEQYRIRLMPLPRPIAY